MNSLEKNDNVFVEKKPKISARVEGILAKGGWTLIHILIYLLLVFRESTDLNLAFRNQDYFYLTWTHSIFILTIFFYFMSSVNPGHVKEFINSNNLNKQQKTSSNNRINKSKLYNSNSNSSSDNENELKYRNNTKKDNIESIPLINVNNNNTCKEEELIVDNNSNNNNIDNNNNNVNSSNNNDELDDEEKEILTSLVVDNYYCNICEINIPLRCKHCKRCNQCIVKYDHHCFFIGRCIGIRNHFYFWLFLLFQAVLLGLGFQIATTGFRSGGHNSTWVDWIWLNVIMISPSMLIFGSFFMPAGLFLFHSYLIITNQTSWEFTKHEKITYLQSFYKKNLNLFTNNNNSNNSSASISYASRQYPYPFSKGFINNIKDFLNGINQNSFPQGFNSLDDNSSLQLWKLPTSDQVELVLKKKKETFSIWDNKYYSCFG